MTTELAHVLASVLSADEGTRLRAEDSLSELEKRDNLLFFRSLGAILADDNVPIEARRVASVVLKNRVVPGTSNESVAERSQELAKYVFLALESRERLARRSASQLAATIAMFEIVHSSCRNILKALVSSTASNSVSDDLHESALEALGYLCEEVHTYKEAMDQLQDELPLAILDVILFRLRCTKSSVVKVVAIQALMNAMGFLNAARTSSDRWETSAVLLLQAADVNDAPVRLAAFQCLAHFARPHRELLSGFIEIIFNKTVRAIMYDEESIAIQALEFWSAIAEVELENLEKLASVSDTSASSMLSLIAPFIKKFSQVLLNAMMCQDNFQDEDYLWNKSAAASFCLDLFCQLSPTSVRNQIIPFITDHIADENSWRRREAATIALGIILKEPLSDALVELVDEMLPTLLIALLHDESHVVRDTTAWTLSRICQISKRVCLLHAYDMARHLCYSLRDQPPVAKHACVALYKFAVNLSETEAGTSILQPLFIDIVSSLLRLSERPDADECALLPTALETLACFVQKSPDTTLGAVGQLVPMLISRLEMLIQKRPLSASESGEIFKNQSLLCSALQACCVRMQWRCKSFAVRLHTILMHLVHSTADDTVREEALLGISSILQALESSEPQIAVATVPTILELIREGSHGRFTRECFVAAVGVLSDACRSLQQDFKPFSDDTIKLLLVALRDRDLEIALAPCMISCLGDVAQSMLQEYQVYLLDTMNYLNEAAQTCIMLKAHESNRATLNSIIKLRSAILQTHSALFQIPNLSFDAAALEMSVKLSMQMSEEMCDDRLWEIIGSTDCEGLLKTVLGLLIDLISMRSEILGELRLLPWLPYLLRRASQSMDSDVIELQIILTALLSSSKG
mmetsp:Transcript_7585/g.22997  ORF Transcript_7585/g.22997 Transcript_7585/m.22997 type:complete len:867 (+) Transcript_7585:63-2663(+)